MPWSELGVRFLIELLSVSVACVLYASALLWIGGRFKGILKIAISLAAYLVMAAVLGFSLLSVLSAASEPAVRQSWDYLGIVIVSWAVMVAPGFIYIGRFKLPQLQQAGFFSPRGRSNGT